MADRQFRFRLPWLSAVTTPRPTAETQPPRRPVETQAPAQPTTTLPIQRPPLRPAGLAPAQPPAPQAQAPQRTEPQPTSPPLATTESQIAAQPQTLATSVPPSPSRAATQTRAASVPPSPSRGPAQTQGTSVPPSPSRPATDSQVAAQPQTQAVSVPPSPSRAATESSVSSQPASPSRAVPQSRAASVPPSPSRATAQLQPAMQTAPQPQSPSRLPSQDAGQTFSQPSSPSRTATQVQPTESPAPSPSKKLQPKTKETSQPAPTSTEPQSAASQLEETKPEVSLPPSQAPQPKTEITYETVSKLQSQAEPTQALGTVTATTPTPTLALEAPVASQKSDSNTIGTDHFVPFSEPEKKAKETEEGKNAVEELKREGKTNGQGTQAKELVTATIHAEQRQKKEDKEDIFETKKTTTISSNREQLKTAKARYISSETHQKPVMSNGEKVPLHKEVREDISKFVHKLGMGHPNQFIGEKPISIVTLAGENRGAAMHIGTESARKDGSIHIHRGYKINPDDSTEATTDGEGSSKGRKSKDSLTKEELATKAYTNSNLQSINNSILFESSVNERDPGVQLIISRNQAEPTKSSTKPGPFETHKDEFNITPAEKLTYEPTIRRRCLRGLFLEPSDSDTDNPEKPQRHGCRYNCGEKGKDKDIGVL